MNTWCFLYIGKPPLVALEIAGHSEMMTQYTVDVMIITQTMHGSANRRTKQGQLCFQENMQLFKTKWLWEV